VQLRRKFNMDLPAPRTILGGHQLSDLW